jgi:hypothetical protein
MYAPGDVHLGGLAWWLLVVLESMRCLREAQSAGDCGMRFDIKMLMLVYSKQVLTRN